MYTIALLLAALVIAADRFSKLWVLDYLHPRAGQEIVTSFFNLTLVWNRGVSFGFFRAASEEMVYVLVAVAGAIVAWILMWLRSVESPYLAGAAGLIIGGAAGNVWDRLQYHAVVDFLDFHAFGWHWPAFNVADMAIVGGCIFLLLISLRQRP